MIILKVSEKFGFFGNYRNVMNTNNIVNPEIELSLWLHLIYQDTLEKSKSNLSNITITFCVVLPVKS